ncbi:stage II sporulation protein R [Sporolactobacillus sp. THM7-4]|nr:stage II sporulation protein R [Sporolactobacillus sp. THM7-4]
MKKSFVLISLLTISLAILFFYTQNDLTKASGSQGPIPDDAIRLRILANSDSPADQAVKHKVRDAVNADITGWVRDLKTPRQAEQVIRAHMPELRQTVKEALNKVHADRAFSMKLGKADFPTKIYGQYVYPAGKYNALVITLGNGKGANWWCVLFPPLCFLDFSNGEAVRANQPPAKPAVSREKSGISTQKDRTDKVPAEEHVEVRSFVLDFFSGIWRAVTG